MKCPLAFSTVASMTATPDEIIAAAKRAGMSAVEIRLENDGSVFSYPAEELPALGDKFRAAGLQISDLGTSGPVTGYSENKIAVAKRDLKTASLIGAGAIRLFLGAFSKTFSGYPQHDYAGVVRSLQEICAEGKALGVEVWAETHNMFSTGKVLSQLIRDVGADNFRIIWDLMHPWEMGEKPEETAAYLTDRIAHVHIKDGVPKDDPDAATYLYTKLGEGSVPIADSLRALEKIGYRGYLSLEWENAWRPEIQNCFASLDEILRHYTDYLKTVMPDGDAG